MKRWFFSIVSLLAMLIALQLNTSVVYATQFDLIAPSGSFNRGQDVQFTVTVDTQGQTLTSTQIGMTYENGILEYVSTEAGDAFPEVTTNNSEAGKLVFSATNNDGFSGTGNLAIVTFKIIATASGSTDLCVLYNPATPTSVPTTPAPTSLPQTGAIDKTSQGAIAGIAFLLLAGAGIIFLNKQPFLESPKKKGRTP